MNENKRKGIKKNPSVSAMLQAWKMYSAACCRQEKTLTASARYLLLPPSSISYSCWVTWNIHKVSPKGQERRGQQKTGDPADVDPQVFFF